jgi:hypothetical protein
LAWPNRQHHQRVLALFRSVEIQTSGQVTYPTPTPLKEAQDPHDKYQRDNCHGDPGRPHSIFIDPAKPAKHFFTHGLTLASLQAPADTNYSIFSTIWKAQIRSLDVVEGMKTALRPPPPVLLKYTGRTSGAASGQMRWEQWFLTDVSVSPSSLVCGFSLTSQMTRPRPTVRNEPHCGDVPSPTLLP